MEELRPATTLSHYRIVSKLGAGGMGEVYLAQDTRLDRKVALKVLPANVAADRTRMRRFVQEAKAVLDEVLRLSLERYVPPYHIALIYAGFGDHDEAMNWLERGYEERDPKMVFLKVEPKWRGLRDDPRFQAMMKKIGLP
jgi:serine/threonine protein kinase